MNWKIVLLQLLTALLAGLGAGAGARPSPAPIVTPPIVTPPTPTPPAEDLPTSNPLDAIGRVRMAGGYCSGTLVNPPSSSGTYRIVTAAHCVTAVNERVIFTTRSGEGFEAFVIAIDRKADIAILSCSPGRKLPFLLVADSTPIVGTKVLHAGFGQDDPGNTEYGTILATPDSNNQVRFRISVSPGDSGGGICVDAGGRLLSPVCCTDSLARIGNVWGGSPERIRSMIATPTAFTDLPPVAMPAPPALPKD